MKKKLLAVGLCLLTVFSLTGCSGEECVEGSVSTERFQKIKEYNDGYTCYDKATGYIYFYYCDGNSGLTILLNKDGKPYKYEGWNK